jgi:hypothetical protein
MICAHVQAFVLPEGQRQRGNPNEQKGQGPEEVASAAGWPSIQCVPVMYFRVFLLPVFYTIHA